MLTCTHPLKAYKGLNVKPGRPSFLVFSIAEAERVFGFDSRQLPLFKVVYLPCGHCVPCRLSRAREWATRCYHELLTSESASFLTLTYNEEHLPADKCVSNRAHQLFMKRLRKALPGVRIRFFMCAEYGKRGTFRPHYHYIIFGYDFPDKTPWKNSHTGYPMCRSALLERLWSFGYSTVQRVSFETCQYVARYVLKKAHGSLGAKWYAEHNRTPEFCRSSNRPGIGRDWLVRYFWSDVRIRDRVPCMTRKGVQHFSVPRYYLKIIHELWPEEYLSFKERQHALMMQREADDRAEAERQGMPYSDWCCFQSNLSLLKARNSWKANYRSYENSDLTPNEQVDIIKPIDEELRLRQPHLFI